MPKLKRETQPKEPPRRLQDPEPEPHEGAKAEGTPAGKSDGAGGNDPGGKPGFRWPRIDIKFKL